MSSNSHSTSIKILKRFFCNYYWSLMLRSTNYGWSTWLMARPFPSREMGSCCFSTTRGEVRVSRSIARLNNDLFLFVFEKFLLVVTYYMWLAGRPGVWHIYFFISFRMACGCVLATRSNICRHLTCGILKKYSISQFQRRRGKFAWEVQRTRRKR